MIDTLEYWERRYAAGGNSGLGSIGAMRELKWQFIDKHYPDGLHAVLDIGCGDLRFWADRRPDTYHGVDFSPTALRRAALLRPQYTFTAELPRVWVGVVFCLDVMFHVIDDFQYDTLIHWIDNSGCSAALVSTWHTKPPAYDESYQKWRGVPSFPQLYLKDEADLGDGINGIYLFKRPA